METEKQKMNVLGLVGLILGIIAAVVAWVPCLGVYAFFPGIVGVVLSAIGLKHVKKGIAIAGLICSLIGSSVAGYQCYILKQAGEQLNKDLQQIEKDSKIMEQSMGDLNSTTNEVVE